MPLDGLWYRADRATQRAEQAYHCLQTEYDGFLEHEDHHTVSRRRFRELARRTEVTGAPYGAHSLVYNDHGEVLLVRHEEVDRWVLPGGEVDEGETFRETAERELAEEADVDGNYEGLALLTRASFSWEGHEAWGVLPVFAARATDTDPSVADPDEEISAADWFGELPEDTRDRRLIDRWRERSLGTH